MHSLSSPAPALDTLAGEEDEEDEDEDEEDEDEEDEDGGGEEEENKKRGGSKARSGALLVAKRGYSFELFLDRLYVFRTVCCC